MLDKVQVIDSDFLSGIAANAAAHDRDGSFPTDSLRLLRNAGKLALGVPRQYGGQNAGLRETTELVTTVGAACASTALILAMQCLQHNGICRSLRWPGHLRELVGRTAAEDGALINALRVEPALGTPARGGLPDTTARRTAQGWSLTGHKIYSTGAPGLTWMLVWARTDDPEPMVGMFLVPAKSAGIKIIETWDQLGLRASGSHDVLLNNVVVPADYAVDIRRPKEWAERDPAVAGWNAMLISAVYNGVAHAARDWLRDFLHSRVPANLGASLATLPRMQEAVGAIEGRLLVNNRLISGAAAEIDAGTHMPDTNSINLIKTAVCDNAIAAVEHAVLLGGNHALSRANPLERHLRDVLCARIHTPQPDMAHLAAGKLSLGF